MRNIILSFLFFIAILSNSGASAFARDAAEQAACRRLTVPETGGGRTLRAAQTEALRLLREYADTRSHDPDNVPDYVTYPDPDRRKDGELMRGRGATGTLLESPALLYGIADGRNRAFVLNPREAHLRVAEDDNTGQHQWIGVFQSVRVPGEIKIAWMPDGDGVSVSLSPRSGCYFRAENYKINSYALLARAVQAIWDIGVYPKEVIILDHERRTPVFQLNLAAVHP